MSLDSQVNFAGEYLLTGREVNGMYQIEVENDTESCLKQLNESQVSEFINAMICWISEKEGV